MDKLMDSFLISHDTPRGSLKRHELRAFLRKLLTDAGYVVPDVPTTFKTTVAASVNHGRWIVKCPVAECDGAVLASMADPVFICPDCGSGEWASVTFPTEWREIERILRTRPEENQNWEPTESLRFLSWENDNYANEIKHKEREVA